MLRVKPIGAGKQAAIVRLGRAGVNGGLPKAQAGRLRELGLTLVRRHASSACFEGVIAIATLEYPPRNFLR